MERFKTAISITIFLLMFVVPASAQYFEEPPPPIVYQDSFVAKHRLEINKYFDEEYFPGWKRFVYTDKDEPQIKWKYGAIMKFKLVVDAGAAIEMEIDLRTKRPYYFEEAKIFYDGNVFTLPIDRPYREIETYSRFAETATQYLSVKEIYHFQKILKASNIELVLYAPNPEYEKDPAVQPKMLERSYRLTPKNIQHLKKVLAAYVVIVKDPGHVKVTSKEKKKS